MGSLGFGRILAKLRLDVLVLEMGHAREKFANIASKYVTEPNCRAWSGKCFF